jgi:signal transduction histidine kinase
MNQVFLNLLINAAHAIKDRREPDGKKGVIGVRTRREADHVVISISDTGCGIPENIHDKIFEPFFTTKEVGRGTGQGLAIARTIVVERHSGSITFDSEVGRGSTFHIRLPIRPLANRDSRELQICERSPLAVLVFLFHQPFPGVLLRIP